MNTTEVTRFGRAAHSLLVCTKLHAEPDVFDGLDDARIAKLSDLALLVDGEEHSVGHATEHL